MLDSMSTLKMVTCFVGKERTVRMESRRLWRDGNEDRMPTDILVHLLGKHNL